MEFMMQRNPPMLRDQEFRSEPAAIDYPSISPVIGKDFLLPQGRIHFEAWGKKKRQDRRHAAPVPERLSPQQSRLEFDQKNWLSTLPWSYAEAVRNPNNKQPKNIVKEEGDKEKIKEPDVLQTSADVDSENKNNEVDLNFLLNPDATEFVPLASPDNNEMVSVMAILTVDDGEVHTADEPVDQAEVETSHDKSQVVENYTESEDLKKYDDTGSSDNNIENTAEDIAESSEVTGECTENTAKYVDDTVCTEDAADSADCVECAAQSEKDSGECVEDDDHSGDVSAECVEDADQSEDVSAECVEDADQSEGVSAECVEDADQSGDVSAECVEDADQTGDVSAECVEDADQSGEVYAECVDDADQNGEEDSAECVEDAAQSKDVSEESIEAAAQCVEDDCNGHEEEEDHVNMTAVDIEQEQDGEVSTSIKHQCEEDNPTECINSNGNNCFTDDEFCNENIDHDCKEVKEVTIALNNELDFNELIKNKATFAETHFGKDCLEETSVVNSDNDVSTNNQNESDENHNEAVTETTSSIDDDSMESNDPTPETIRCLVDSQFIEETNEANSFSEDVFQENGEIETPEEDNLHDSTEDSNIMQKNTTIATSDKKQNRDSKRRLKNLAKKMRRMLSKEKQNINIKEQPEEIIESCLFVEESDEYHVSPDLLEESQVNETDLKPDLIQPTSTLSGLQDCYNDSQIILQEECSGIIEEETIRGNDQINTVRKSKDTRDMINETFDSQITELCQQNIGMESAEQTLVPSKEKESGSFVVVDVMVGSEESGVKESSLDNSNSAVPSDEKQNTNLMMTSMYESSDNESSFEVINEAKESNDEDQDLSLKISLDEDSSQEEAVTSDLLPPASDEILANDQESSNMISSNEEFEQYSSGSEITVIYNIRYHENSLQPSPQEEAEELDRDSLDCNGSSGPENCVNDTNIQNQLETAINEILPDNSKSTSEQIHTENDQLEREEEPLTKEEQTHESSALEITKQSVESVIEEQTHDRPEQHTDDSIWREVHDSLLETSSEQNSNLESEIITMADKVVARVEPQETTFVTESTVADILEAQSFPTQISTEEKPSTKVLSSATQRPKTPTTSSVKVTPSAKSKSAVSPAKSASSTVKSPAPKTGSIGSKTASLVKTAASLSKTVSSPAMKATAAKLTVGSNKATPATKPASISRPSSATSKPTSVAVQSKTTAAKPTLAVNKSASLIKTASANSPKPSTVKAAPTSIKAAPSAMKTAPSAVAKATPSSVKAAPKASPSAVKAAPSAVKAAPSAVKAAPSAVKAAPSAVKAAPSAVKPVSSVAKASSAVKVALPANVKATANKVTSSTVTKTMSTPKMGSTTPKPVTPTSKTSATATKTVPSKPLTNAKPSTPTKSVNPSAKVASPAKSSNDKTSTGTIKTAVKTSTIKPSTSTEKSTLVRPSSATAKSSLLLNKPSSPVKKVTATSTSNRTLSSENSPVKKTAAAPVKALANKTPTKTAPNSTTDKTKTVNKSPAKTPQTADKKSMVADKNAKNNTKNLKDMPVKVNDINSEAVVTSTTNDIPSENATNIPVQITV